MLLFKRNFCILFLCLFCCCGFAMADVFNHPVNKKTKHELEKSLAKVMNYEVASGDFKQTKSIKKRNRKFISTGTFLISKKNGIVWKTLKPIFSELALNNGGVFERDSNGQSHMLLTKDNPMFADVSNNIQALFSGKISELEKNFNVYYQKQPCGFKMGLVPREGIVRMVIANVVIEACKNIDKVIITDAEDSPVTLEFLNYKTVGKIAPKRTSSAP